MSAALGLGEAAKAGRQGAFNAMAGNPSSGAAAGGDDARGMPGWARAIKDQASARHHRQVAMHAIGQGTSGGAGATPDIKERED